MMKVNQLYKGFKVLAVEDVPDCSSKGIYLKHEKTGLEVFHLLNEDEENTFAFIFATPNEQNTGVAHIIEHSVLCGSKKYPLKDPFIRLENQSLNTYLNAYTTQDFTVFPSASVLKADYFNLMGVYADAVFFPLLRKEIFMQEGWRLEPSANGKTCEIQGVVFNEMKGNYSSFESVAFGAVKSAVLEGSHYVTDYGGDPLFIPSLTYEQFKAFHKKHYCAANCRIFLCGNIPTEEQLDFIEENVLSKVKDSGKKILWPEEKNVSVKKYMHAYGPADSTSDTGKNSVILAWKIDDATHRPAVSLEVMFLSALLWGNDCAPVQKALLDSALGEDVAPQTGDLINIKYPVLFCGLRGVQKKDEKKVKELIFLTLENLCKNGIPKDDLDRVCMEIELSNKEIVRIQGPASLYMISRSLRGWGYGAKPWETLLFTKEFEALKKRIAEDSSYLPSLIRKYLLQNKNCTLVTVTATSSWSRKRALAEKKLAASLYESYGKEKLFSDLKKLKEFQEKPLSKEEESLIPCIGVEDLKLVKKEKNIKESLVKGVTVFESKEPTNGISYLQVAFPADVLDAKDYIYLPCLCMCVSQVGWGNQKWDKAQSRIQSVTAGLGAYTHAGVVHPEASEEDRNKIYVGRDWIIFQTKFLEENTKQAMSLVSECICQTDFSDTERLKELVTSQYNSIRTSVIPYGNYYAYFRASCKNSRVRALIEIWDGLSSVQSAESIAFMDEKKLAKKLKTLLSNIKEGGAFVNMIATKKGLSIFKKELPSFIENTSLKPLGQKKVCPDSDFYKLTELKGFKKFGPAKKSCDDEYIEIPGTVGFSAYSFPCVPAGTKEGVAQDVYAHLLSTTTLWNEIRMKGGSYGVSLTPVSTSGFARFTTYRNPLPFSALDTFKTIIEQAAKAEYTKDVVDKAITGCYSDEVVPKTPSGKGMSSLFSTLYGNSDAFVKRDLKWLLKISAKDIKKVALFYENNVRDGKSVVMFGSDVSKKSVSFDSKKQKIKSDEKLSGKYIKIIL